MPEKGLTSTKNAHQLILGAVLTVPEVVEMFQKNKKTVMMAIYRERLEARQTGGKKGTWLVSKSSAVNLWGQPQESALND